MSEMTRLSPAPWRAVGRALPNGKLDYWIEDAKGQEIAALYAVDGGDEPVAFPVDANALAMAAAPDLLAALRGLVEGVTAEVNEKGGGGFVLARLADARAAIQKAEGKP